MIMEILWYSTAVFSVWGSSLGGISVPFFGLLYPYRVLVAVLLIVVMVKSKKADGLFGRHMLFTILPVLAYMILHSIVSLLWAQDQIRTVKAILNYFFVAAFLILFFRFAKDRKSLNRLLIAVSINMVAILLVGVFESFSNIYLFCDPAGVDVSSRLNAYGLSFPVVCFTNPNDFAFVLSLSSPLMLYVLDESLELKRWLRVTGKILVIALTFFVTMQTSSRLGYIVYFLIMGIYLLMQLRKSCIEAVFLLSLATTLVMTAAGIVKIDFRPKPAVASPVKVSEPITAISQEDESSQIRLALLQQGLLVTRDTWGLGAGAKNSPKFMARYQNAETKGIVDYHFFYMELLADYGVIPLLLFLCFQAGAFLSAITILRRQPENRWMALLCLPGVVGFTLASANCSSSMFIYMMWFQFALWSLPLRETAGKLLLQRKPGRLL